MVLCIIVGCGNKSGKSSQKKDSAVKFSRVSKIVKNEGEMMEELSTRRRRAWISAISRDDLTDDKLENERVCYRHFVSCQAAKVVSETKTRSKKYPNLENEAPTQNSEPVCP